MERASLAGEKGFERDIGPREHLGGAERCAHLPEEALRALLQPSVDERPMLAGRIDRGSSHAAQPGVGLR
jgi:hypothetical protein